VAYAVAVGGVKAIALIGHNDCGMVGLENKREQFVSGLVTNSLWTQKQANDYFCHHVAEHALCAETDILRELAGKYRSWFPMLPVAMFLYRIEDQLLYLLQE
jgi:carbonic anhydrase